MACLVSLTNLQTPPTLQHGRSQEAYDFATLFVALHQNNLPKLNTMVQKSERPS